MCVFNFANAVRKAVTANIAKTPPEESVDTAINQGVIECAKNNLNSRKAADCIKIAVLNNSLHYGVAAAMNHYVDLAQHGEDLKAARTMVTFYRDHLVDKSCNLYLFDLSEELAYHLHYLHVEIAAESPNASMFFGEKAEQIRDNLNVDTFVTIMDTILEHWDSLCSHSVTYDILALMANIIAYITKTAREDIEAFMNILEKVTHNWPA